MKKLLSAFLALVILLATGASALTKEEIYTTSVDSFLSYLNDDDTVSPEELLNSFASLGAYEWSMQYMLYVNILMCVQNNDFSRIQAWLGVLRGNAEFCAYLAEESKNSKVGSVDELEAYANAKKALYRNDVPAALEYFRACPNFMDSTQHILSIEESILSEKYERANELNNSGAYSEAAALFRELEGYENSAALLETCEFMIMLYSLEDATEEEAQEVLPAEATESEPEAIPSRYMDDTVYTYESFRYKKLNNGKIEITGYMLGQIGGNSAPIIPSQIDGLEVCAIGDLAFFDCGTLTSITIPESVSTLGLNPFLGQAIATIRISKDNPYFFINNDAIYDKESMTLISVLGNYSTYSVAKETNAIGGFAFSNCTSLKNITLPDSISKIGINPFYRCSYLTDISVSKEHPYLVVIDGALYEKESKTLISYPTGKRGSSLTVPNGITTVGDYAFYCSGLNSITLPDGVTRIGDYAFFNSKLQSITLPDSVTRIGDYAFSHVIQVRQLHLPKELISIGDYAFDYCNYLSEIHIPECVTTIGKNPFTNCGNLLRITVSADHPYFFVKNGVLYGKNSKSLICCPKRNEISEITIPEGIEIIGEAAFYDCNTIAQVTLPEGVLNIEENAFYSCDFLASVTIPESVTSIGDEVFPKNGKIKLALYLNSYTAQYAMEKKIRYEYVDALDWLNG